MENKTLEKPENMATENTVRLSSSIEPNFMNDAIPESTTINGVRVGNGYNFDDVSVSDLDVNNIKKLLK